MISCSVNGTELLWFNDSSSQGTSKVKICIICCILVAREGNWELSPGLQKMSEWSIIMWFNDPLSQGPFKVKVWNIRCILVASEMGALRICQNGP